MKRLTLVVIAVVTIACGGNSSSPASPSAQASSGVFTGTWSGTYGPNAGVPLTLTLSQNGSTVVGVMVIQCAGCIPVSQSLPVKGTASGNTATVAITQADGSALTPVATFTVSGTSMSTQWPGSGGIMVTGTLTAGAPPAPSPSPTPAPSPSPTPAPASGKYDAVYDFSFTHPQSGGTTKTEVLNRFFIVRNGRISSADGTSSGAVTNNDFGNVTFTAPCWDGSGPATWTGTLNALGGFKTGAGEYVCNNIYVPKGAWRAYNGS